MVKEFKSTNELIEILNSKGVSIKDENNVKYLIEKYSYYSIVNSYKWIFKIGENYKDNASFEEIFAMYKFDKNLKIIMLKYILEIEAVIKTKIANLFAEKYGLEDYLNINNFDLKDDNSNLEHIEKLIEEIKNEIDKGNSKHDAITHYMSKYGFVPPWVVTKILSIGTISKFYGLMKQQDRQEISKQFHINDRILKNILGNLTSVRNIAAHDDRLYTYRSTFYIRLDKTKKSPDKALHTNMYIIIKSLEFLNDNLEVTYDRDNVPGLKLNIFLRNASSYLKRYPELLSEYKILGIVFNENGIKSIEELYNERNSENARLIDNVILSVISVDNVPEREDIRMYLCELISNYNQKTIDFYRNMKYGKVFIDDENKLNDNLRAMMNKSKYLNSVLRSMGMENKQGVVL